MIPRYQPNLHLEAWGRWLLTGQAEEDLARDSLVRTLDRGAAPRHTYVFAKGRYGLYAYLSQLKRAEGDGVVLVPAQICPVVAHAVQEAGFVVRFVDSDSMYPTPSAGQYLEALEHDTAALIIAPMYGYLQTEWQGLLQNLGSTKLVLDMAQGLMSDARCVGGLQEKAAAVFYSFGPGKGIDTGGALLLSDIPLDLTRYGRYSRLYNFGTLLKMLVLRLVIAGGLYGHFIKRLELEVEGDKITEGRNQLKQLASSRLYPLWWSMLDAFAGDIARAGERARLLGGLSSVQEACSDQTFFNPPATFLRQIIRLRDGRLQRRALEELRRQGIDSSPAGEPLPNEYFDGRLPIYANARAFREEGIRLPFLGRMTDSMFQEFQERLDASLTRSLN